MMGFMKLTPGPSNVFDFDSQGPVVILRCDFEGLLIWVIWVAWVEACIHLTRAVSLSTTSSAVFKMK